MDQTSYISGALTHYFLINKSRRSVGITHISYFYFYDSITNKMIHETLFQVHHLNNKTSFYEK